MKTKVLTILASAVVAFGLWFYVISVEHTQTDRVIRDVEVTMVGEETLERLGLMITSDMDKKVDLTLVGNRRVLGSLKKSDIEVSVDLTEFYLPGEKKIKYEVSFHGIKNGEIEVVSIKADTEMLLIEEWATKEIPVEIRPEADAVGEAFEILNKEANHTTVTIRGPKVVVDQIHLAALFINKDDIQKNMRPNSDIVVVQKVYTLCNQDGNPVTDVSDIETNRGEIRATMQVSKIKEVNFGYTVKPGGGLKGDANDVEDGTLVHYKNVIGKPVFSIPKLGYLASYIQQPPGLYMAISVSALFLALMFIPDLLKEDEEETTEQEN